MRSSQARELLEDASRLLESTEDYNRWLINRESYNEAQENYNVSAEGIKELRENHRLLAEERDNALAGEDYEKIVEAEVLFQASKLKLDLAEANRQKLLTESSEWLVNRDYALEGPARLAKLATFNNFVILEANGFLDEELAKAGSDRDSFRSLLENSVFRSSILSIETQFIQQAHETKDEEFIKSHENTRKLLAKKNFGFDKELLKRVTIENRKSFS